MNHRERSKILRSERGTALRDLAGNLITSAEYLPTKTEIREALEETYPGDGMAKFRETLYGKLVKIAEQAQDRRNRFALHQVVDELVIQVETKLADDERIVPVKDEPTSEDIEAAVEKAADPYADRIGGDLERKRDAETAEAQEILRRAGRL